MAKKKQDIFKQTGTVLPCCFLAGMFSMASLTINSITKIDNGTWQKRCLGIEPLISKGIGLRVWFVSEIDILSGELYTVGLQ